MEFVNILLPSIFAITLLSAAAQNAMGLHLGPFDCWLTLRGLKTMSLRMEKQASNCEKLVEYLSSQPLVTKINYPGLKAHPGYDVHASQVPRFVSYLHSEANRARINQVFLLAGAFTRKPQMSS